jgi:hypothetical protein
MDYGGPGLFYDNGEGLGATDDFCIIAKGNCKGTVGGELTSEFIVGNFLLASMDRRGIAD